MPRLPVWKSTRQPYKCYTFVPIYCYIWSLFSFIAIKSAFAEVIFILHIFLLHPTSHLCSFPSISLSLTSPAISPYVSTSHLRSYGLSPLFGLYLSLLPSFCLSISLPLSPLFLSIFLSYLHSFCLSISLPLIFLSVSPFISLSLTFLSHFFFLFLFFHFFPPLFLSPSFSPPFFISLSSTRSPGRARSCINSRTSASARTGTYRSSRCANGHRSQRPKKWWTPTTRTLASRQMMEESSLTRSKRWSSRMKMRKKKKALDSMSIMWWLLTQRNFMTFHEPSTPFQLPKLQSLPSCLCIQIMHFPLTTLWYRKASSRGAYDPFWSVLEEHRLHSTTRDIITALFIW